MAKSGKHKRIRRQEKTKTQLKGSTAKVLGKAQNVIEPKLQTKKILLREQLQPTITAKDEQLTTRKRSIHDVLASLNHHNVNTKIEALSGLHELITSGNEVIDFHLGKIVNKLAQLTSDLESNVRKENLHVAETLFSQISEDQVQPFWNLLLTHLKCTLTDLNPSIRQSCVAFLTILITHCPNSVASSKQIMLPAMLSLISSTARSSNSQTTTRLKIDIGDKASGVKERMRVLSLISSCLNLHINDSTPFRTSTNSGTAYELDSLHANLYYPFGYSGYGSETSTTYGSSSKDVIIADQVEEDNLYVNTSAPVDFFVNFINSCIPILCETWIEIAPSAKTVQQKKVEGKHVPNRQQEPHHGDDNVSNLNKNAVEVLQTVVDVIVKLLNFNKQDINGFHGAGRPGRRQEEALFSNNSIRVEKFDSQVMDVCVSNVELIRALRKTFGQDLQKYFFNFLPFSSVQDNQRHSILTVNLQLFHVAATLKLVDHHLMDKFENCVKGMMKRDVIHSQQVTLVLEAASMIRVPRIGVLCESFIVFAMQAGCQELVYDFLENLLALKSTPEASKFADTIDWDNLCPFIVNGLVPETAGKIVSILTLLVIRNRDSIIALLREKVGVFKGLIKLNQSTSFRQSILRMFYYAQCLDMLTTDLTL